MAEEAETAEKTPQQVDDPTKGEVPKADENQQAMIGDMLEEFEQGEGDDTDTETSDGDVVDDLLENGDDPSERAKKVVEGEEAETGETEEVQEPETEEEPENREEREETEDRTQLEELREEFKDLKRELKKEKAREEEETETEEDPVERFETPDDVKDFVDEETFENLTQDRETFNNFVASLYERVTEDVLRDIPNIVRAATKQQVTVQNELDEFWRDNSDLREHADFVSHTANKVQEENPDLSAREILSKTEQEVREELDLQKRAKDRESERRENGTSDNGTPDASFADSPNGPRQTGSDESEESKGRQQQMIDKMMETVANA